MQKIYTKVTDSMNFFEKTNPYELVEAFGSPLYVYNERILRQRCRELKQMVTYPRFVVDYSAKANCNLAFLQIVRSEGLTVDAMSPGEIYAELAAGFPPEDIFYICNNVSEEEMNYAIQAGVVISVDSLCQLEQFGNLCPGGKVAVRFNPGVGAGHSEKVVTGGKKTKFAVNPEDIPAVKSLLKKHDLKLIGINQHIGSLFMTGESYLASMENLFEIVKQFPDLEFVDFGGGFGIPYHKEDDEPRLDLEALGREMDKRMYRFAEEYGKELTFRIEPGRYVSAECCVLLGQVHAIKQNHGTKFIGTDLGFNVLQRPVMYDSYHGVEVYRHCGLPSSQTEAVTIVGNICESGDILAKDRVLPEIHRGDLLGVLDAGAYGYTMASTYNNRLRPAEVLLRENGTVVLIRRRETLDDLLRGQILL